MYGAAMRGGRVANARALDRPRAFAGRVARGVTRPRSRRGRGSALGAGGPGTAGDGAPLERGSALARRAAGGAGSRPDRGRGAHGAPGDGRGVLAAAAPGSASI